MSHNSGTRRTRKEPPGYGRTHRCAGSGPCGPGFKSRAPDQIPVQATPTCRWSSSVGPYIEGRQIVATAGQVTGFERFSEPDRDLVKTEI